MSNQHPSPQLAIHKDRQTTVSASGSWQVHALAQPGAMAELRSRLQGLPKESDTAWDLTGIEALDHIGAQLFWNAWGKARPARHGSAADGATPVAGGLSLVD